METCKLNLKIATVRAERVVGYPNSVRYEDNNDDNKG
jgi:hypothetical protein